MMEFIVSIPKTMMPWIVLRFWKFHVCGGENRMEGWTGMAHLPWGDVKEARNRAKFPRWGN
jgi:hypothetical protein